MNFIQTGLQGVYIVEIEAVQDERGFFARSWCKEDFERYGLVAELTQCNISFNIKKGTLRGMHYQVAPYEEVKLVRCTAGAIYDVIVDLRPDSLTYKRWTAVELSAENHKMVYVPQGMAHGFQTLTDNAEVFYQMSADYRSEHSCGVRWDDPAFAIKWPFTVPTICRRDQEFPLLET